MSFKKPRNIIMFVAVTLLLSACGADEASFATVEQ